MTERKARAKAARKAEAQVERKAEAKARAGTYNSCTMKNFCTTLSLLPVVLCCLVAAPLGAQSMSGMSMDAGGAMATPAQMQERLGTVSFPVSCAAGTQVYFDRGVALVHDFWYEEAGKQFARIVKIDPGCAMAHWGVAMSSFHQIWGRPDAETMATGWKEMQAAEALPVKTQREKHYIAALAKFFKPGKAEYPARIAVYSEAMGKLYAKFPEDVNAGAFYALSLLAAETPDDLTQTQERKAMVVLTPLFAKYPNNPGVVHYIVHACDNPAMAAEGLAAADHYGEIAQSGPHAFHMPGHIYSRLGLWQKDEASQLGSIAASQAAEKRGESGIMDEPHSYDFLIYAYLQSGQDIKAKKALEATTAPLDTIAEMKGYMAEMVPYYRLKLPGFYAVEMHNWKAAAAMEPVAGMKPDVATGAYWFRVIGDGHLKNAEGARADLAKYDALIDEVKKSKDAYEVEGIGATLNRDEMLAWVAYAEGKQEEALKQMRAAADIQDKVGQGEVDIPAREMLADMLLDFGKPKEALAEYAVSLKLSPNRLNGLFNAGRAAEAAGEKAEAAKYYEAMLKSTDGGEGSARPEFAHAKSFVAGTEQAAN
jgi:tetratricopeptide (TPR) repeat protein